jgi:OOP family OmpA-OmpF porin
MTTLNKILLVIIYFLPLSVLAQKDIEGKDHPLVPRYPGSEIVFFDETDNRAYELTLGPMIRNSSNEELYTATDTRTIKGKITRLQYLVKDDDFDQIVKYYEEVLKNNGFELIAFTKAEKPMEVAGRNWTMAVYDDLAYKLRSNISGTKGGKENRYYIVGQIKQLDQKVMLAIIINEFDKGEVYVHMDIIGPEVKVEKQSVVNAKAIETDIKEKGYAVIYGIYFDNDKAEIKKGSEAVLNEIARYLKINPGVLLYVIGHTDMAGKLDFKIALSKSRADAVVKILTSRYFIASERLIPDGVGPLSPVATNQDLEGRKKNERIELVLRSF